MSGARVLVVGGSCSGKRRWVRDHLGYTEDDMTEDLRADRPVLVGLQDRIEDIADDPDLDPVERLRTFDVIVCDEVGCGLVPVDATERKRRERVGRLCCALAGQADVVVRVTCGIGQPIKGALPKGGGRP